MRPESRGVCPMTVVPLRQILDHAFAERYGVAAINVVDDLTLEAVLAAATELDAPLIVPTPLKTVKSIGAQALYRMWRARADEAPVPVTLHLDHCPEREWISTCLRAGWNSVLFDGSGLDVGENTRQTVEVVTEAEAYGAQVEGEIESVLGVEDGVGSDEASEVYSVEVSAQFIAETGGYCFRSEAYGAQVEGEIESVLGVEDGVGSDEASEVYSVEVSAQFIAETGVYCF